MAFHTLANVRRKSASRVLKNVPAFSCNSEIMGLMSLRFLFCLLLSYLCVCMKIHFLITWVDTSDNITKQYHKRVDPVFGKPVQVAFGCM